MNELNSSYDHQQELYLLRYIKPSYIVSDSEFADDVFQLREDRSPPEEYISFFHSISNSVKDKIQDVVEALKRRGFINLRPTCGFLNLNASLATEEINLTNDIVEFRPRDYPKYGMHYLSKDVMDIVEAKTILMHHSNFYLYKNYYSEPVDTLNTTKKIELEGA